MRITPLDVRKQEFNKSMRGFDCDEVRAFLNTLADEYETVLIDNKQIRERVIEQDEKIAEYMTMERTLRDTLMSAERVMSETRDNAGREGDLIVQEAQMKAKGILEECRLRTEELRREIVGLRKEKETYLARFRGLAEAQIRFIDTHESDFEDLDKRLVDIVDNVVTSATVKEAPIKGEAPIPTPRPATSVIVPPVTPVPPLAATTVAAAAPAAPIGVPEVADPAVAGPEVAPTPVPAPIASETDIWRDYSPGQATPEPRTQEPAVAEQPHLETPPTEAWVNESKPAEEDAAGSIADLVSESLAETDPGGDVKVEAVAALNIDVISNGESDETQASGPEVEAITESENT